MVDLEDTVKKATLGSKPDIQIIMGDITAQDVGVLRSQNKSYMSGDVPDFIKEYADENNQV